MLGFRGFRGFRVSDLGFKKKGSVCSGLRVRLLG